MCLSPGKKGLTHAKIFFLRCDIRTPQGTDTVPGKMQNGIKVEPRQGRQTNAFINSMTIRSTIIFCSNASFRSDASFCIDAGFRSTVGIFRFYLIFFLPKKKAFHVKGEKLNSLLSLKSFFIPTLRAQNPVDFMSLF